MGWVISKDIEFCYGHRVHTQTLNSEYADDLKCACRHLHGHEGKITVYLESNELDNTGMVTDFRHLEWLKKFVNNHVDHRFILDYNDPLYDKLIGKQTLLPAYSLKGTVKAYCIDLTSIEPNTPEYEYLEGFLLVDFVPTSENLAKWIFNIVTQKMGDNNYKINSVKWSETPKSHATYNR